MHDHLNAALAGRYAVERELGRGGMASVWLARDLRHDRPVAIKVLLPELAGAIGPDRFVREVRLTARLQHPNIVTVFDSGVVQGPDQLAIPWYAMAFVPGESLRARIDRERQLPVDEAVRITAAAAAALHAAHREGIVHRDIKPENVLLAGSDVYVADFGIAKAVLDTGAEKLTNTGFAIGTPAYMSPEQAMAETVDPRTDQYSLACVLYEMLTGEPPFTGATAQAIMARRLTEPPRAIRPVRPSVPAAVEAALLRALERVPADRFTDVAEFAGALRGEASAPSPPRSQRPLAQAVGAAVVVGLIVLGAWLANGGAAARDEPDSEAAELSRQGRQEYERRTPTGLGAAIESFKAVVARDPRNTVAWAGLAKAYAQAYGRRFVFPGVGRDSVVRLAVAAADRALLLDSTSSDVWITRAIVIRMVDPTDVGPSLRLALRALALDSSNAEAWHFVALSRAESGDLDAGLAAWRRSVRADPAYRQVLAFLGLAHYWRRDYDSAAFWADSSVAVDPVYLLGRTTVGQIAAEVGNIARGRAAFDAARRVSSDVETVNTLAGSALIEARGGDARAARAALQRAEALAVQYEPAPLHTAVFLAHAYAELGDVDRAIEWLRRYTPRDDLHFQLHLRCDPPYDALAADPRFRALLRTPRPATGTGC